MNCIYCADRRWTGISSEEHIWPRSLGGDACPPIFRTRQVCKRCNDLAGLWVDAPFRKNWFVQGAAATAGLRFLDPRNPGPSPLLYMGFDDAIPVAEDEVCERWNGPAQEMVFHIHKRDEPRWDSIIGGDVIKRKAEAGRVYILFTCPVDYWVYVALLSVIQQFPKAERRCLTRLDGVPINLPIKKLDDPLASRREADEIGWLLAHAGEPRQLRMSLDVGFSDRFLAKLALGFSHTVLGSRASASNYADSLRARLWNWDIDEAETCVRGTGFWNDAENGKFEKFFDWPHSWVLVFGIFGSAFGLSLVTPSGKAMSMMISDDKSLWPTDIYRKYRDMHVYVIVPQRQWCLGPLTMLEWTGHKFGRRRMPALQALETAVVDIDDLPPRIRAPKPA